MRDLAPHLESGRAGFAIPNLDRLLELENKRHRSKEELLLLTQSHRKIAALWPGVEATVQGILSEANVTALRPGIDAGLIRTHAYRSSVTGPDGLVNSVLDTILEVIREGRDYPLLDDQWGKLLEAGFREGAFPRSASASSKGGQVGLASGIFERLPALPGAGLDEILDIRKELAGPLVRFRAAILDMNAAMTAEFTSEEFEGEVQDRWVGQVQPELEEIREAIRTNSYLRELGALAMQADRDTFISTALAFGVSHSADMPALVSAVAGVGVSAVRALWKQTSRTKQIREQPMFYLHSVAERLNGSEKPRA